MGELNVRIPPELERWIEVRLAEGRYVDLEDYVRDLVRRDLDGLLNESPEHVDWVRGQVSAGVASGIRNKDAFETLDEIRSARKDRRG